MCSNINVIWSIISVYGFLLEICLFYVSTTICFSNRFRSIQRKYSRNLLGLNERKKNQLKNTVFFSDWITFSRQTMKNVNTVCLSHRRTDSLHLTAFDDRLTAIAGFLHPRSVRIHTHNTGICRLCVSLTFNMSILLVKVKVWLIKCWLRL